VNNEIVGAGYKYVLSTSTVEIDSKYIRCSPLLLFEFVRFHIAACKFHYFSKHRII